MQNGSKQQYLVLNFTVECVFVLVMLLLINSFRRFERCPSKSDTLYPSGRKGEHKTFKKYEVFQKQSYLSEGLTCVFCVLFSPQKVTILVGKPFTVKHLVDTLRAENKSPVRKWRWSLQQRWAIWKRNNIVILENCPLHFFFLNPLQVNASIQPRPVIDYGDKMCCQKMYCDNLCQWSYRPSVLSSQVVLTDSAQNKLFLFLTDGNEESSD